MIKRILSALAVLILCAGVAGSQVSPFPQSLPPSTVVGRTGISAGPAQAIPFTVLQAQLNAIIGQAINVKALGAKGDGVSDDTAIIQVALNSYSAVYIPTGTYIVSQCLTVPSNRYIYGDGWASILKGSASLAVCSSFTPATAHFILFNNSPAGGNSNITIYNLAFDMTVAPTGGNHSAHFRNVSNWIADRIYCTGGGDCVSGSLASNFKIINSIGVNNSNASFDVWDSSTDGLIANNHAEGCGASCLYGILVTGANTTGGAGTTRRVKVIGNTIQNVGDSGISNQGNLSAGSEEDIAIIGNSINTATNSCIRLSESLRPVVSDNSCVSSVIGILSNGEVSVDSTNAIIANNRIRNVTGSAIKLAGATTKATVLGNIVSGTTHTNAIEVAGTNNTISGDNVLDAGSVNTILNSGGATNTILQSLAGVPTFGVVGQKLGSFGIAGSTSGTITVQPQAAAGTYNWNWPTTAGASGTILQSGGGGATAMAFSTATYPATTTANQLLYSSSTNTVGGLTSANSSALITDASGVPSWQNSTPTIESSAAFAPQWTLSNTANDANASFYIMRKSRAGGAVTAGDLLGQFTAQGFANGAYRNSAVIGFTAGTPSGNNVPSFMEMAVSNSAGQLNQKFRFDSGAHFGVTAQATAPTISAGCSGAGSSVGTGSSDFAGNIVGSTAAATTCTITFGTAFANTPSCVTSGDQSAILTQTRATGTLVVTFASTANFRFNWICSGV